jgi:uroporphyrinogen decarboxylase
VGVRAIPDASAPGAADTGASGDAVPELIAAYRSLPTRRRPVWFMRQAGRALPEYRSVRKRAGLLEITRTPDLAAEVTVQPVRRYGVDAAILFSDIVTPLDAIGVELEIRPGIGPVIASPIRSARDLSMLRAFDPAHDAPWLAETVSLVCRSIDVPLIGFVGGPFTLASYLVEGGPSKAQARTKTLMLSDPETWEELLSRLSEIAISSARAQVQAGAAALQVFDSWIGSLSREHYLRHVLPSVRRLFDGLAPLDVPRIYFGVGTDHLLEPLGRTGADVIGIDWRVPLDEARARLPNDVALQGNLDPVACLAPLSVVEAEVRAVLARAPDRGHVFNLGHGVLPETDPDVMRRIVEIVHSETSEPGR